MRTKSNSFNNKRVFFAFPYLALSIIFVVVPLVMVLVNGFLDSNGNFSFDNFSKFFDKNYQGIWKTVGNSFLMGLLTTIICLLLSYPLALALLKIDKHKRTVLVMLFVLPMWINSLLRIASIKVLFSEFIDLGFGLVLIGMIYEFLPFMLLPIYTVLVNTDKAVIEASHDLGASPLQTLIKVRLPLSVPGILSGVLMVFMPTMSTFAVSEILSGNTFKMFGNLIDYWFGRNNFGMGSAYSIMLMALIAISMLIASRLSKGKANASMGGTGL